MTVSPHESMNVEAFLAWTDAQTEETLFELVDGHVVACANGSPRHDSLVAALQAAIAGARGADDPCRTYPFRGLRTDHGVRRPDVLVTCAPPRGRVEEDATFVVEVLSESTTKTDLTTKVREYMRLPSLRQYLALDPEAETPFGYLFTRTDLGHHTQTVDQDRFGFADVDLDLQALYDHLPTPA